MSDQAASSSGGRHRGREVALQVLYAIDLAASADAAQAPPGDQNVQIFDRISENFVVPIPVVAFARELVAGVVERIDELDGILGAHARNWRVSRMAAVDRNVLRLAVYELRETDTPVAVVIDEAVDLARRFGSEPSPAFVNGVLDAVAREIRAA
jgi:N utilization substance protein B